MTDHPTNTYEGDPPLDPVTQRFVDAVLIDDPSYSGVEAVDLFWVLKKAGLSITVALPTTTDDLLTACAIDMLNEWADDNAAGLPDGHPDWEDVGILRYAAHQLARVKELEAWIDDLLDVYDDPHRIVRQVDPILKAASNRRKELR